MVQKEALVGMEDCTSDNKPEKEKLLIWASLVTAYLIAMIIGSLLLATILLAMVNGSKMGAGADPRVIWLCIFAGTLGSSVSALISVADRISHGWEFSDGSKWPKDSTKKDMFGVRMIVWFIVRPFLGSAMGFIVFVGVVGGFLLVIETSSDVSFVPQGLVFLAVISGLFAKTFLQKLRDVFDMLFASREKEKEQNTDSREA